MNYTVATNFDNNLIQEIARFGTVKSVYGKLRSDIVGGGRVSHALPEISMKRLADHIACCHLEGISFNYLLNATCIGNRELTRDHRKIFTFIDRITGMGANSFTVANTNLLKMMRRRYPDLNLASSLFFQVRSLDEIRHLEDIGANEITLFYNFNRNFALLEKAVSCIGPETKLRLIANNTCIHNCFDIQEHANYISHMTQAGPSGNTFTYDAYRLNCGLQKIKHPAKLISSDWIRPEDVHFYEAIGKGKILLKLTDRIAPTAWLLQVVKAYSEKKKEGNLLDILSFPSRNAIGQIHRRNILSGILKGNVTPGKFVEFARANQLLPIHIDNAGLEGFLEGMQKINCSETRCSCGRCSSGTDAADGCTYCKSFAERVITIDEDARQKSIEMNTRLLEAIYRGNF
jgi:collagenase-like PrtC family protease